MARERYVTRTIEKVTLTAMVVDTTTATVKNVQMVLPSLEGKSEAQVMKMVQSGLTDTEKVVQIVSRETSEELYGMPEIEFLKMAQRLDPETRKPLDK